MVTRLQEINTFISEIEGVTIINNFYSDGKQIRGSVKVEIKSTNESLDFEVLILPQYPLRSHNAETITFFNSDLIEYSHVMCNGSICIHTSHNTNLKSKLIIDFNSLKRWIEKYYVNKDLDDHYEHINISVTPIDNIYYSFLYTDVEYKFKKNEFGFIKHSQISKGSFNKKEIYTSIIHGFQTGKDLILSSWKGITYTLNIKKDIGLFIFLELAPVHNKKFIVKNWIDLEPFLIQEFLDFLHYFEKQQIANKNKGLKIPLLLGYSIPDGNVHWESTLLEIGKFPIRGYKENQKYYSELLNEEIQWCISKNCSYDYFFGRGRLNDNICQGKILIIGVGAVGSMIATSLTRGGCTKIDLADFDNKEPENVCRSEYSFITGITNKIDDLGKNLVSISPFLEIGLVDENFFELYTKALFKSPIDQRAFKSILSQYNLIFDCTADNDLMFVLNNLELPSLITLSITNESRALVCATEPRSYEWVLNQFESVLEHDIEDLYNPTGCWNPTFKASYNDINTLVQFALKHINLKYKQNKPLKNFVLQTETENNFNINLKEF